MRSGDDGRQYGDLGHFSFWFGGLQAIPPAGGSHDCGRDIDEENGPHGQEDL